MDRTGVRSTNIVSVGWESDPDNESGGILEVEFKAGVVYQFTDVPEWIYKGLIFAPSPGRYFHQNVAEAYDGQRIE